MTVSVVVLVIGLSGCDSLFDVTNPGPVQDEFLNEPSAFDAVVTGMERAHARALGVDDVGDIAKITAAVTREIFPAGNINAFGIEINEGQGILIPEEQNGSWAAAQKARWVAEAGIERMERVLGAEAESHPLVARAYMWAGFANRLLGENMCQAVIDGGAAQPSTVYLERAEEQFSKAVQIAKAAGVTETELASIAGRAAVRLDLRNWSGALADANKVPEDFEIQVQFQNTDDLHYNALYWAGARTPFREVTVWNTPYLDYYETTGDPRTPWGEDPEYPFGNVARPCCGQVPFMFQKKYTSAAAPIDLADGRELKLIRAEVLLHQGSWQEALGIINELRASVGVGQREASTLEEAWKWLKRERGIELWLEGRRMNDIRRWQNNDVPGELWPLERPSNPQTFLSENRDLCLPISRDERVTNPNIPEE